MPDVPTPSPWRGSYNAERLSSERREEMSLTAFELAGDDSAVVDALNLEEPLARLEEREAAWIPVAPAS